MLKRRKTIENGIIYDGNIPYSKQADSGKIAEVNARGEWEIGNAPSGGSDLFIATFTWDSDLEQFLCDKSLAEIIAADADGKQVFGRCGVEGPLSYACVGSIDEHDVVNKYTFRFIGLSYYDSPITLYDDVYSITADTVTEDSITQYTLAPVSP